MTMGFPNSESQHKLVHKLMTQWNDRISSPKFDSINVWIRAYINDAVEATPDSCSYYEQLYGRCWSKTYKINADGQKSLERVPFVWWRREQPDNRANMEYNVVMTGSDQGKWNDVAATSLQHTICEYSIPNVKGAGSN